MQGYSAHYGQQNPQGYYNQPYYNGASQIIAGNPMPNNSYQQPYGYPPANQVIYGNNPNYNVRINDHQILPQQPKRV